MPVTNSTSGVPVGATIYVPGTTAPPGFIKKNGALLSRTAYAALWAFAQASGNMAASDGAWQVGQFSPGDGATTFRIPDGRAEFVRGLDDGRGVDAGRVIGSAQGHGIADHSHTLSNVASSGSFGSIQISAPTAAPAGGFSTGGAQGSVAIETRPRNVAELACIKY